MTEQPLPARPHLTPAAEAVRLDRLAREAAALRENLRKRRAQARARQEDDADGQGTRGPVSG